MILLHGCLRCSGALTPDALDTDDLMCLSCGHRRYAQAPEQYRQSTFERKARPSEDDGGEARAAAVCMARDGWPTAEIAADLEASVHTVRSWLAVARRDGVLPERQYNPASAPARGHGWRSRGKNWQEKEGA